MASFVLRKIDEGLWQRFKAKAAAERLEPKHILLTLIEAWVSTPKGAYVLAHVARPQPDPGKDQPT